VRRRHEPISIMPSVLSFKSSFPTFIGNRPSRNNQRRLPRHATRVAPIRNRLRLGHGQEEPRRDRDRGRGHRRHPKGRTLAVPNNYDRAKMKAYDPRLLLRTETATRTVFLSDRDVGARTVKEVSQPSKALTISEEDFLARIGTIDPTYRAAVSDLINSAREVGCQPELTQLSQLTL
jgi:hypothetical protein